MDAQVLSHAERNIWCLGIASSDADGKSFSVSISRFQIRFGPDTQDVIATGSELRIPGEDDH